MDYHGNIDKKIAEHLQETGKTQKKLANEIGLLSAEALSMKRSGKTDFKLSEIMKLCKILGVDIDELVFG